MTEPRWPVQAMASQHRKKKKIISYFFFFFLFFFLRLLALPIALKSASVPVCLAIFRQWDRLILKLQNGILVGLISSSLRGIYISRYMGGSLWRKYVIYKKKKRQKEKKQNKKKRMKKKNDNSLHFQNHSIHAYISILVLIN